MAFASASMGAYVLQKLAAAAVTLVGALLFLFVLIRHVPGDLAGTMLGPRATPELRAAFNERMGLDRSIPEQLWHFMHGLLRGDLGDDVVTGRPIAAMIWDILPNTLILAGTALVLALFFGVLLGALAALKPGSFADTVLGVASVALITTPSFVIAIFLLLIFSIALHWLPVSGAGESGRIGDQLLHLILPAVALALVWVGYLARLVRASLLEVLSEQHVRLLRAYGVSERRIVLRWVMRLAMVPTVAVLGVGLGDMISNAVFIEIIFARPGLGSFIYNAIMSRNFPLVQAGILVTVVAYVAGNLLVDVVNAVLDPRIARSLRSQS